MVRSPSSALPAFGATASYGRVIYVLVAISAIITSARLDAATNSLGQLNELYVIAAVVIGGTFFEAVFTQDKVDEYKDWLRELGLTYVEISDGVTLPADIDPDRFATHVALPRGFDQAYVREGGKRDAPRLQASARFDRLDFNQLLAPDKPAAAAATAANR